MKSGSTFKTGEPSRPRIGARAEGGSDETPEPPELESGEVIDNRFQIVSELGRGGFGVVYHALDLELSNQPVALKLLRARTDSSPDWIEEVIAAASFDHENIVKVYHPKSHGTYKGYPYIVFELLIGESLDERMSRGGMHWREALAIACEVAAAMRSIHRVDRVHGDLTPRNIFLLRKPKTVRVKLLDLGLMRSSRGPRHKRDRGGTPGFAAPEGSGCPESEVFSAAMVIVYCLNGGDTFITTKHHLHAVTVPPPGSAIDALPAPVAFRKLLGVAVSRFPIVRPANGDEWADALAAVRRWAWLGPVTLRQLLIALMTLLLLVLLGFAAARQLARRDQQWIELKDSYDQSQGTLQDQRDELNRLQTAHVELTRTQQHQQKQLARLEDRIASVGVDARAPIIDMVDSVNVVMRPIPAGEFYMGTPPWEPGHDRSEEPQHAVDMHRFYISEHEVWFRLWDVVASKPLGIEELPTLDELKKRIKERNKRPSFTGPQQPVVMIDWREAQAFAKRMRALTHRCYRLPTEAEWEWAARAGTSGPFALKKTTLSAINYNGEPYGAGTVVQGRGVTVEVGSLHAPNAFGLHDMHGNVWEWCQDQWHETYVGAPRDGSAWEDGENPNVRVLRGSSWGNPAVKARSGARFQLTDRIKDLDIGFRLAFSPREQCSTDE